MHIADNVSESIFRRLSKLWINFNFMFSLNMYAQGSLLQTYRDWMNGCASASLQQNGLKTYKIMWAEQEPSWLSQNAILVRNLIFYGLIMHMADVIKKIRHFIVVILFQFRNKYARLTDFDPVIITIFSVHSRTRVMKGYLCGKLGRNHRGVSEPCLSLNF